MLVSSLALPPPVTILNAYMLKILIFLKESALLF